VITSTNNLTECKEACVQDENCKAVDWDPKDRQKLFCFIHTIEDDGVPDIMPYPVTDLYVLKNRLCLR